MEGLTTGDLQEVFKAKRENHINCYLVNFSLLSNMSKAIKKKNQRWLHRKYSVYSLISMGSLYQEQKNTPVMLLYISISVLIQCNVSNS